MRHVTTSGVALGSMIGLLAIAAPTARAANMFLPGVSSATITHLPSTAAPGLGSPTFPATTTIGAVPTSSTPPIVHSTTFTSGGSTTTGSGGAAQFNTFPSTTGYGNVSFAYGTGVGQTDASGVFGAGASTLTVAVDMSWDISAGWSGPRTAYELMSVALKTTGAGDIASVTGDFSFHVDLNAIGSPGDDILKSVHVDKTVTGGATLSTTLFASTLLTTNPIAAAGAGEKHIFRITGMWVFSALDPSGDVSVELADLSNAANFGEHLSNLQQIDPNLLTLLDNDQLHSHGGGTYETPLALIVPEPGTVGLLGVGLMGLLTSRKKCFSKG
ncbi:MAG: PEP-CTERM sorting domain-containing protein [Planctomycetes bacterium]|nr:PEP-CTERM sorting domain-containing protein [Planctomycetota bacterium]